MCVCCSEGVWVCVCCSGGVCVACAGGCVCVCVCQIEVGVPACHLPGFWKGPAAGELNLSRAMSTAFEGGLRMHLLWRLEGSTKSLVLCIARRPAWHHHFMSQGLGRVWWAGLPR